MAILVQFLVAILSQLRMRSAILPRFSRTLSFRSRLVLIRVEIGNFCSTNFALLLLQSIDFALLLLQSTDFALLLLKSTDFAPP